MAYEIRSAVDPGKVDEPAGVRVKRRMIVVLATVGAFLALVIGHPAQADPQIPKVPDAGARPPVTGLPAVPAGAPVTQNVPTSLNPLVEQIRTETAAVQTLSEQLTAMNDEVVRAAETVQVTQQEMDAATRELADLRSRADSVAADAYKDSRRLGPLSEYAADLHRLSKVAPAIGHHPGGEGAARDLSRAEDAEQQANAAHRSALEAYSAVVGRRDSAKTTFDQRNAALNTLISAHAAEIKRVEDEADAYERSLNVKLGAGANGWAPHPDVEKVIRYALSKRGSPYVFGDEGPLTYDCSGLVWDSYRQVGKILPRIAADQYNATAKISAGDLLPGDLVFFGPPGPWQGIGHVGIYLGGGDMIQAPRRGDVVKISPVQSSRLYGATRVLPAHRVAPAPTIAPQPSTSSSKPPSPSPTSPSPSSPSSPSSSPPTSPPASPTSPNSNPPASKSSSSVSGSPSG